MSYVGPKADHSIAYSEKPSKAIRFISLEIIMQKLRGNLTSSEFEFRRFDASWDGETETVN